MLVTRNEKQNTVKRVAFSMPISHSMEENGMHVFQAPHAISHPFSAEKLTFPGKKRKTKNPIGSVC